MPNRQEAKPSPVVLQAVWPRDRVVLDKSAYRVAASQDTAVSLFAYNFSDAPVTGKLSVTAPIGWNVEVSDRVELAAGQRKLVPMTIHRPVANGKAPERIRISGEFGPAGEAVLSMRVLVEVK